MGNPGEEGGISRKWYVVIGVLLVTGILLMVVWSLRGVETEPSIESGPVTGEAAEQESPAREIPKVKEEKWLTGEILPGKGFEDSIVAVDGFGLQQALNIVNALRGEVDFRRLTAGQPFRMRLSDDGQTVLAFSFDPDAITHHKLTWNEEKKAYDYKLVLYPTKKRERLLEGRIESTLNQALKDRGDVSSHVRNIVNGVLECLVSFRTDARTGDTYHVLVEDRMYKGAIVPPSVVLYASYDGKRAGFHEAFLYNDGNESSAWNGHYDRKGKALVHSALRYPLDRIHVTSTFGRRRHPVTGRLSFHYGVDYRASTGTPVYAVAKGRVIHAERRRYDGKYIELKHLDGTRTFYLHLSRLLVRKGEMVKAHQEIGLSGATGRVTAAHLHFGIKAANGKWVNPLKKRMIAAPILPVDKKRSFDRQVEEITALLRKTPPIGDGSRSPDKIGAVRLAPAYDNAGLGGIPIVPVLEGLPGLGADTETASDLGIGIIQSAATCDLTSQSSRKASNAH